MTSILDYDLAEAVSEDAASVTFRARERSTGSGLLLKVARRGRGGAASLLRRDFEVSRQLAGAFIISPSNWLEGEPPGFSFEDDGSRPLSAVIADGRMSVVEVLEVASSLASAVQIVHAAGLVHCGIADANVWLNRRTRQVRLTGFGRSQKLESGRHQLQSVDAVGRARLFMAPEHAGGLERGLDFRSDYYSIGALLYSLLTDTLPFDDTDPTEVVHAQLARPVTPPSHRNPAIPRALSDLVVKLLAKEPEDRYQGIEGLKHDLAVCLDDWKSGSVRPDFVAGAADVSAQFRLSQKLYGREELVERMLESVERCRWGRKELVCVKGPPGIGKSALVRQLHAPLRARGDHFIAGKYEQYSQHLPYFAVAQAFRALIRQVLSDTDEAVARWRARVTAALGPNLQVITDVIPDLELLAGPAAAVEPLAPQERRNRFNRTFADFIQVFTEPERSLALFLDDVQWADPASLSLLSVLLRDPSTSHLLVIAAYRDAEITPSHPLKLFFAEIDQAGISALDLAVAPLTSAQVKHLLTDSLRLAGADVERLAALIHQRTEGNPLHVRQVLESLRQENMLAFEPADHRWVWNLSRVEHRMLTSGVVELMTQRIGRLSDRAQDALKIAACLGSWFDLDTLANAAATSRDELRGSADEAVTGGLLRTEEPAGDQSAEPVKERYRFVHDRVQAAAFSLIPPASIEMFRFTIGQRLMRASDPQAMEQAPFEILNNINFGSSDVLSREEAVAIAGLNLGAGRKARSRLAYEEAVHFLRHGLRWLPADAWHQNYDLTFQLHAESFECEYLAGFVQEAETRFERGLTQARSRADKAALYYTKVQLDTSIGRSQDAIDSGLKALGLYGIRFPRRPQRRHILWEFVQARWLLGRRKIADLEKLPVLDDAERETVVRLLMSIGPAGYFLDPNILILSATKAVNISLRYGNAPASGYGYVIYAMVLGVEFGNYVKGHAFGKLAISTTRGRGENALYCRVLLIFAGFVSFWRERFDKSIALLDEAFEASIGVGDVQYANYSILQLVFLNFTRGQPLSAVEALICKYEPFVAHSNAPFAIDALRLRQETIRCLRGQGNLDFSRPALAGVRLLDPHNVATASYASVLDLQLAYLFEHYDAAHREARRSEERIAGAFSQIVFAEHHLFSGLTAAARINLQPGNATRRDRTTVARSLRKLKTWAVNSPPNFEGMYRLMLAESLAARDEAARAIRAYDDAISASRAVGMLQIEALAHRLAARYHARHGSDTISAAYDERADRLFLQWGASALVKGAGIERARLMEPSAAEPWASPDLLTVKKATLAILQEAELGRLIPQLLDVVIESARAERGLFVGRDEEGRLWVDAEGSVQTKSELLSERERLDKSARLCVQVVQLTARTGRPVQLGDACSDNHFGQFPYVTSRALKSVVSIPVIKSDQLLGIFYLENNLLSGVFTNERVEIVSLIASEAAFAIDHGRLYLQQSEANRALRASLRRVELLERAKSHLSKFVPQSVQRIIDSDPDAPVFGKTDREVSILFLDIVGYTHLSEHVERQELDDLIERSFSAFLGDIYANEGDINETTGDGLMILFQNLDPRTNADQAVRTAVAIQRRTRSNSEQFAGSSAPIVLKLAINSGVASVGSSRYESLSGTRYTYTASGTVTNVAARIAAIAQGGEILVSEATASRIGDRYDFDDLGPHTFKNVSDPVRIFRLRP